MSILRLEHILTLMLLLWLASPALADEATNVEAAVQASAAAWNRGDLEGFMDSYWRDDALRFASGNSVIRGWEQTLERYRARYGEDAGSMGRLRFDGLEVALLSESAASVFGRFHLTRESGVSEGLFTLLLRRLDDRWVIVADHTSSE